MTEAEWLASTDPRPMLEFLPGKVSERKSRLLRVAAARSVWPELTDERYRAAVEVAERYADGQATEGELDAHRSGLYDMFREGGEFTRPNPPSFHLHSFALSCVNRSEIVLGSIGGASWSVAVRYICDRLPPIIRDIYSNPFCPTTADPRWLTPTALGLAQTIYTDRAFDRLPILADALEDAGCANPHILAHCRADKPHVRGCWVVDLILGKE